MSSSASALQGTVYQGFAEIREMGLQGMITLRGDLNAAKVKTAVKAACGVDMPRQREIAFAGDTGAAWMSPDEALLMAPHGAIDDVLAKIEAALAGEHFLAVNVSDARAVFQLRGAGVREVIAKLCPVDMAPEAFGPGMIRRTRMAQIPAAFWMVDEETIRVVCFRSVAEYAFHLLKDAVEPGGEVGLFGG